MKYRKHLEIFFDNYVKPRIDRGEFIVILVVGESNTGKTWTSTAMAEYFEYKLNKAKFKPEQFILTFEDYSKLFEKWYGRIIDIDRCVKYKSIIWDEAARCFHAKRAMSNDVKKILDILQTARVYQHIYFFLYQKAVDVPPDIWRNAHYLVRTYFVGKRRYMAYYEPRFLEATKRGEPSRQAKPLRVGLGKRLKGKLPTPTLSLIKEIEEKVMAYKMKVNVGIDALAMSDEEKRKWRTFGFLMEFYDFNNGSVKVNIDPDMIDWDKAEDYERDCFGNYQARFKKLYTSMTIFQVREFFKQLLK